LDRLIRRFDGKYRVHIASQMDPGLFCAMNNITMTARHCSLGNSHPNFTQKFDFGPNFDPSNA
jgi:hypothetical protein